MTYTEEEINNYIEILQHYTKPKVEFSMKSKCCNCHSLSFTIDSGYKVCIDCGTQNGHILGFFEVKDYDRLHFRKKSIYQRNYHYEKKVDQISKRINLTDEQKYELFNKLITIDNNVMEILNKKYCRKRMISIFYLIKKLLEEMGCEKYKLVYLKISPQTLDNYEKWWDSYKSLNNSSMKAPVGNSS